MVFCNLSYNARIYITLSLTLALMVSELVVGYTYNSNTLVADSFHMFSDAISFIVSLIAIYKKPQQTKKARKTFGYRRAEQVGAMIHGSLLLGLSFSVGTAAILRIVEPEKIDNPKLALIVGSCGLIVDLTGIGLFFQDDLKDGSMNIRSLFLEKIGDLAGTVIVIITCALSYVYDDSEAYPWVVYVDPVGTLLFCCVLLWATKEIFHMVLRILMQDAPSGFQIENLNAQIEQLGVKIIKNNIWQIDNHEIIMSITVEAKEEKFNGEEIKMKIFEIFKLVAEDFQDFNVTIQVDPFGTNAEIVEAGHVIVQGVENEGYGNFDSEK